MQPALSIERAFSLPISNCQLPIAALLLEGNGEIWLEKPDNSGGSALVKHISMVRGNCRLPIADCQLPIGLEREGGAIAKIGNLQGITPIGNRQSEIGNV
jgi:hypothetical protein